MNNLTDTEIQKLKNTTSEAEWNAVCDEIKAARNGEYPQDWYRRIVMSGLMTMITSRY